MPRIPWLVLFAGCASAPEAPQPMQTTHTSLRPVHTYSIVARDSVTGEMGVAVQSHWFSVGSIVSWAEAGVGAVATQSFVEPAYGPGGLDRMRSGMSAGAALKELVAADADEAVRQVAFVDAQGRAAAHTGARCIQSAGHQVGAGYSVQANMMLNADVVPAMVRAFEGSSGKPLAERLMLTLEAAQAAGGDIRGQQSAALLVVRAEATGNVWEDRLVDLRIEDHPTPVSEMRRLLELHTAYQHMNAGDAALETGDMPGALESYAAAAKLVPGSLEIRFWNAFTLSLAGEFERSLPIFREVFEADANWEELLRRLPAAGLAGDELVERILEQAGRD